MESPLGMNRCSGSRPTLPTMMTLFTDAMNYPFPAVIVFRRL
jgi:hypothetical protein